MSSGSEAVMPSNRHVSVGGGVARSTREAGQRPRREGVTQDSLFDESNTAAPEADPTVSTKLAGLVARARKEVRLTNVVQYVDEELLRLAFRSLRKQAAPDVDGQSYEDYAANVDENLKDLHARLTTGRYQAPVIRRVYIPHDAELLSAPRLLAELPLQGAVVTGDALYCQRALCQQIVAAGGDYAVIVKGNQPHLQQDILLLSNPRRRRRALVLPSSGIGTVIATRCGGCGPLASCSTISTGLGRGRSASSSAPRSTKGGPTGRCGTSSRACPLQTHTGASRALEPGSCYS